MATSYPLYDDHGWLLLLAAIARRWWLDGLERPRLLCELAEWLEVDVEVLRDTRPARFYSERTTVVSEEWD
jgi:hypothetical protein